MSSAPLVPDIRPCMACGSGVLCDEGYPPEVKVVCADCRGRPFPPQITARLRA